ncbi:MAG: ATP-binding protein [Candidatus Moranbacteria bacterium]|nr:ATP-binding protein [Candidatus Moranbacteria bacterium]
MKKEKQRLIILCGEAFSGKTTLSKKLFESFGAEIVGRDRIYFTIEKILALESTPDEDDDSLWNNLWPVAVQGAKNQMLIGNSVVFDDNCLLFRQREDLRAVAKDIGVDFSLVYLDIPVEVLRERKARNKITRDRHDVPSGWLTEDAINFERPTEAENPIIYTENFPFDRLLDKIGRE